MGKACALPVYQVETPAGNRRMYPVLFSRYSGTTFGYRDLSHHNHGGKPMYSKSNTLRFVTRNFAFVLVLIGLSLSGSLVNAQYTMSYQGTLTQNDAPVSDGLHQLTVTLYSDPLGNEAFWTDTYATEVKNGIFNLQLGSGKSLPDSKTLDRSLWVGVSVNGTAEMRPLTKLVAVPMALNVADRAVTINKLAPEVMSLLWTQSPQTAGDWSLTGNNSLTPGTDFLGTTDASHLEMRVNSSRVMTYMPNSTSSNILGGSASNTIDLTGSTSTVGAAISGGGSSSNPNRIGYGTGSAATQSDFAFLSGGHGNKIDGPASFLGGGYSNHLIGSWAVLGGGYDNTIGVPSPASSANYAVIAGGYTNTATGEYSFIGSGSNNTASNTRSSVVGGASNTASGDYSSVLGGQNNIAAGLRSSVLGGGALDITGSNSLGFHAYDGSSAPPTMSASNTMYLGNVNLWLYNNDNDPRELRFYEADNGGSGFHYSSFTAATNQNDVINYILPSSQGSVGDVIGILSQSSGTGTFTNTLGWLPVLQDDWQLVGNVSTSSIGDGGSNFLGTIDAQNFEIRVFQSDAADKGSKRVMRYEHTDESPNIIGGYQANARTTGVKGATIAGGGKNGSVNQVTDHYGFVGGGIENQAGNEIDGVGIAVFASVVGGKNNRARGESTFIGGGENNAVNNARFSAIVAGQTNTITLSSPAWSIIGAGDSNTISQSGFRSMIGAGKGNKIKGQNSFIGAGGAIESDVVTNGNIIDGDLGFIGAGKLNQIHDNISCFIGAGDSNEIHANFSVIGGGFDNKIEEPHSTIGGGRVNLISGLGNVITIPGGDNLIGQSYAQTVVGARNIAQGESDATHFRTQDPVSRIPPSETPPINFTFSDDRIVIVGNGFITTTGDESDTTRSNAFEVTNGGYSIVYSNLNDVELIPKEVLIPLVDTARIANPIKPAVYGASYQDNLIIAWGDVPAADDQGTVTANSSFGVASIVFANPNVYTITLNNLPSTTDLNQTTGINQGSVVVTPNVTVDGAPAPACLLAVATSINNNVFKVFTFDAGNACDDTPHGFMFQVVGRR